MGLGEFALQEIKGAAYTLKRFVAEIRLGQHFVVRALFSAILMLPTSLSISKPMPFLRSAYTRF